MKNKFFIKNNLLMRSVVVVFFVLCCVWTFSFVRIYFQEHSRIAASNWIYENIPSGSTLAVEHWDDELPIGRAVDYNKVVLPLYDADTNDKWTYIEDGLDETDFIIISS
ncbi:MAG: hypothetical protein HQK78_10645, partial [Desulfobacterales bacterium]|nr:hypothetical protein [Desulfobacterales bacterium]